MARFDKYNGECGGFRATLAFAIPSADVGKIFAVRLNGSGHLIKSTDAVNKGVVCATEPAAIGDRIDVMTAGEIVDVTGLAAGTDYAAAASGALAAGLGVGWTVEAWRLIVRANRNAV